MGDPDRTKTSKRPLIISGTITFLIFGLTLVLLNYPGWISASEEALLKLEHIGAFLAGACGIITIVWLIATLLMQLEELSLQRDELAKQRKSWEATSLIMRSQLVLSLKPVLFSRLDEQAVRLAELLVPNFDANTDPIRTLTRIENFQESFDISKETNEPLLSGHITSYIAIYEEFVQLMKTELMLSWPTTMFLPTESPYVRLYHRLKRLDQSIVPSTFTQPAERQTFGEFF